MNGILCIDKPVEYTSFDVVARIRGMSKTKKVGHGGTLDPMATGVLPVFLGTATKAVSLLPNNNKRYLATFQLGIKTDTLDSYGKILSKTKSYIKTEQLEQILPDFRGEISQLPPMYSAVRVNGRRLYDFAREGKEIERTPRMVTVYQLELTDFDEASQRGGLDISCSKGTYIRTIIQDIGERLSVGGVMTGLVRTEACGFTLDDCLTLEQVQERTQAGCLIQELIPVDRAFRDYPLLRLNEVQADKFRHGVKLDLNRIQYMDFPGMHRVYGPQGAFLGLAKLDCQKMELAIEKLFDV